MATIAFGFFAVLIAREWPGRRRVWPYLLAGVVVSLLGFARLYLGAHWLSDVVAGMLLGIVWLLALGIAYRRHVQRSFWMRPLAAAAAPFSRRRLTITSRTRLRWRWLRRRPRQRLRPRQPRARCSCRARCFFRVHSTSSQ